MKYYEKREVNKDRVEEVKKLMKENLNPLSVRIVKNACNYKLTINDIIDYYSSIRAEFDYILEG